MTPFATGQAQSKAGPYDLSSAYGQRMGTMGGPATDPRWSQNGGSWQSGFQAYAPSTPVNRQQWQNSFSAWTMPKQELLQWGQSQSQGSAPLQARQGPSAQDVWSRNAAIVGQINNTAANQQVGTYLGEGAPPTGWGQTSYNPQQMTATANQMVQQGWQNPFQTLSWQDPWGGQQAAPQQAAPQQDPGAAIRNLLQGYNIPQNVMEQIGGMLGGQQGQAPTPGQAQSIQGPNASSPPASPAASAAEQQRRTRYAQSAEQYRSQAQAEVTDARRALLEARAEHAQAQAEYGPASTQAKSLQRAVDQAMRAELTERTAGGTARSQAATAAARELAPLRPAQAVAPQLRHGVSLQHDEAMDKLLQLRASYGPRPNEGQQMMLRSGEAAVQQYANEAAAAEVRLRQQKEAAAAKERNAQLQRATRRANQEQEAKRLASLSPLERQLEGKSLAEQAQVVGMWGLRRQPGKTVTAYDRAPMTAEQRRIKSDVESRYRESLYG